MTPGSTDHPQMLVEEFEQIARTVPETVTLEFINGKLGVKPVPDGDHDEIILWVQEQLLGSRPDLRLYRERGLRIGGYRNGRARPDGTVAPRRFFAGHGEWSDAAGVLMTVEVTSYDADTNERDRRQKRDGYAAAGIPVYLLIDRDSCMVSVHSAPRDGVYGRLVSASYGAAVEIPDPIGITLDTEELKELSG
ncbi:Uma2 family endonuclease [Streptomyces oceani]|uniref:Putative restriction endonuclease domain-containing protein n=1 Tax=Streptomyces oceani TaxID=1075402 RepID=A0A1E7JWD1_9ACTN|nr:Uma2 family endonuclease [Streptomyces oceani]OEU95771.1 hypothetical protein AN216_23355 [Streptomyces oceani]